ncbi:MAG: glycosyltransferase [Gammaproteobacteria bacterium]|nr:glycosyltransferase [Gammaproteobacteria bacterium]
MDISVIIPTFNRKHTLCRAIDSVVHQKYRPDEIIVIDDGSTDNTKLQLLQKYPEIKYEYQANRGVSAARNNGISIARNSWIAFLDSDDRWHKNKLNSQLKILTENPEYKICHTNETWIKDGKKINQKKKHQKRGGYIFKYCLPLCVISPSSILIHRDIFDDIGMFDESLPACEDYELWLRMCAKYPLVYISQQLVEKYGGHPDQLSRRYWGMDRFRIRAMEKILHSGRLNAEQKKLVQDNIQSKLNIFLNGAKKHNNPSDEREYQSILDTIP